MGRLLTQLLNLDDSTDKKCERTVSNQMERMKYIFKKHVKVNERPLINIKLFGCNRRNESV